MKRFEDIQIGDSARLTRRISEQDILDFARISGDTNPVHSSEEFASKTRFKKRIAHGFLVASLISTVLGTIFPGPGTIYLSQELRFRAPVYIDDELEVVVEVIEKKDEKRILVLRTDISNSSGVKVIEGKAVVLVEQI